jgi:hypothetical protein
LFFPFTREVLYTDTKYVEEISFLEASLLAKMLLRDTQFGIVQHPVTKSLSEEHEAILASKRGGVIVDSFESLALQVMKLDYTLTETEKHLYGVEGRLHARRLKGKGSSSQFDEIWFDELNGGCDRDQIAFYAAAARMGMTLREKIACGSTETPYTKPSERCGTYVSKHDAKFRMFIHGDLSSAVALSLPNQT